MTVARGRFFRPDFDRGQDFVVVRPFQFNGKGYHPGQTLDKGLFVMRRLRQLYDQRVINQVDPAPAETNGFDHEFNRGAPQEGPPAPSPGVEEAPTPDRQEDLLEAAPLEGAAHQPGRVPRRAPGGRVPRRRVGAG